MWGASSLVVSLSARAKYVRSFAVQTDMTKQCLGGNIVMEVMNIIRIASGEVSVVGPMMNFRVLQIRNFLAIWLTVSCSMEILYWGLYLLSSVPYYLIRIDSLCCYHHCGVLSLPVPCNNADPQTVWTSCHRRPLPATYILISCHQ
jgi:hypothetical protein